MKRHQHWQENKSTGQARMSRTTPGITWADLAGLISSKEEEEVAGVDSSKEEEMAGVNKEATAGDEMHQSI